MRVFSVVLALASLGVGYASPMRGDQQVLQVPSVQETAVHNVVRRKLYGRFLHITDLHADPFYKIHSSTEEGIACHRGSGPAGIYGAETSDCDSPFTLINETFKWIENNLRDTVDFVVWTGDSARHDNDEKMPRSTGQVLDLNRYIAEKFVEVFGNGNDEEDPVQDMFIPVVPTFGNNDILPHNILLAGPNKWLHEYAQVWRKFIPEEQRHSFQRGGWFWVEVIPKKLAVISLNTLYFFDHNAAVDGCALRSEPGWEHMEWLRIQLQFMREQGMKAILMGHVPPARTESKQLWDETCWQKYVLWLKQYRDVVITGLYGHMNIDHFLLHDTNDIDLSILERPETDNASRIHLDDELTINSAADYLEELREGWSKLPNPPLVTSDYSLSDEDDNILGPEKKKKTKQKKSKEDKVLEMIGGPWGERYQLSTISPSVVPNFFPTLRVIEYNITGLEENPLWGSVAPSTGGRAPTEYWVSKDLERSVSDCHDSDDLFDEDFESLIRRKKKKHRKSKHPKKPNFIIPPPPSKLSPPGPAYSPQTLTLLGYTQYFANLTYINNDLTRLGLGDTIDANSWHEGKHKDKKPEDGKPHPKKFTYEVEYSTFNDSEFGLRDLTVRSYLKLAHRIGQYQPSQSDQVEWENELDTHFEYDDEDADYQKEDLQETRRMMCFSRLSELVSQIMSTIEHSIDSINAWVSDQPFATYLPSYSANDDNEEIRKKGKGHKKGHKKNHDHKLRNKNSAWLVFIKRAFVGTLEDEEVKNFQLAREMASLKPEGDN